MLFALALTALAQLGPCGPGGPIFCTGSGVAPPALSFADATGVGMGTACAGTVPTFTNGAATAFARTSAATCLKGSSTSIAIGDMVTLSANIPLIQPRPDLGTGPVAWQYEPAGINLILNNQDMGNLSWSTEASGAAVPVVTVDACSDPLGGTTADKVHFPATTGVNYSDMYQIPAGGGTSSGSMYVMGFGGSSGSVDLSILNAASTGDQLHCAFNGTTYTECKLENINRAGGGPLYIGQSGWLVAGARAAIDVCIWRPQLEASAYATSSILSTGTAGARTDGTFTVAQSVLTTAGVTNANGCVGGDIFANALAAATPLNCGLSGGDSAGRLPFTSVGPQIRAFDGTNQNSSSTTSTLDGVLFSMAARWQTGVGINSYSPLIGGDGTLQATYSNNSLGGGAFTLGHAQSGCNTNDSFWMSRLRFDTYLKGCH